MRMVTSSLAKLCPSALYCTSVHKHMRQSRADASAAQAPLPASRSQLSMGKSIVLLHRRAKNAALSTESTTSSFINAPHLSNTNFMRSPGRHRSSVRPCCVRTPHSSALPLPATKASAVLGTKARAPAPAVRHSCQTRRDPIGEPGPVASWSSFRTASYESKPGRRMLKRTRQRRSSARSPLVVG